METQSPCSPLCGCLVITFSPSLLFELPCSLAFKSLRSCQCPLPLDITFVGIVLSMQDKAFVMLFNDNQGPTPFLPCSKRWQQGDGFEIVNPWDCCGCAPSKEGCTLYIYMYIYTQRSLKNMHPSKGRVHRKYEFQVFKDLCRVQIVVRFSGTPAQHVHKAKQVWWRTLMTRTAVLQQLHRILFH